MVRPRFGWRVTVLVVIAWAALVLAASGYLDSPADVFLHGR